MSRSSRSGDVKSFIRQKASEMRDNGRLTTRVMAFPPRIQWEWGINEFVEGLNQELIRDSVFLNTGVSQDLHQPVSRLLAQAIFNLRRRKQPRGGAARERIAEADRVLQRLAQDALRNRCRATRPARGPVRQKDGRAVTQFHVAFTLEIPSTHRLHVPCRASGRGFPSKAAVILVKTNAAGFR